MKKLFGAVCIVFAFASCVSNKTENAGLNGMIYNEKNEGVNGVKVFAGENQIAVSDLYGHFYIPSFSENNEELYFKKKNYETSSVHIEPSNQIQLAYVKLKSYKRVFEECEKLIAEKKFSDAECRLEKIILEDPDNSDALFLLAVAEFKGGKKTEAGVHLEKIADPDENVISFLSLICEEEGKEN